MGGPALGVAGRGVRSNGCGVASWGAAGVVELGAGAGVRHRERARGHRRVHLKTNGESYVGGFYLNLKKFYIK